VQYVPLLFGLNSSAMVLRFRLRAMPVIAVRSRRIGSFATSRMEDMSIFEIVHRQLLDVIERGIAGAEVVTEIETPTSFSSLARDRQVHVVDADAFRELQGKVPGSMARSLIARTPCR